MPPVYSASSSQWPLLQSKTENKFKSGLFNVSAEFIRPVGNDSLPTEIETSIGPVEVWPEPTVSVGTDGFERITATGYGIWEDAVYEVRGVTTGEIKASILVYVNPTTDPVSGVINYETAISEKTFPGYVFEEAHLKQMRLKGASTLPAAPILKVLNSAGQEINQFNVPINADISYGGSVQKTIQITNVNATNYGAVEEVDVVYSITQALVSVSQPPP